jgi:hypothetical protein
LCELLAALPDDAAISVEVPTRDPAPPEVRARRIYLDTQGLFEHCRRVQSEW